MKIFVEGGLGDAVMICARIKTMNLNGEVLHVTTSRRANLRDPIEHLYHYYDIDAKVEIMSMKERQPYLKDPSFSHILGSHWKFKNDYCRDLSEINPFPHKSSANSGYDVLINVSSGFDRSRKFTPKDVKDYVSKSDRRIVIVGQSKLNYDIPGATNFVNNTSLEEYVDLLRNTPVTITHGGFACYQAGLAGRKVFYVPEYCSSRYIHPKWNTKKIRNLHV